MKQTIVIAMTAVLALGVFAFARPSNTPANDGAACVQAGLDTLKALDLLEAAAQKQIDYSTLADPVAGPIFLDLPEGTYLSLGQVVKLHTSNPELFAWCGGTGN